MCIDSCNLLNQLNESKNGQCPMIKANTDCSSKTNQIAYLAEINTIDSSLTGPQATTCTQDSDCSDIQKCCAVNPICPEQGNVCQKPLISDFNIPSIPVNLTITERKKGKTVILNWQSVYDKKQPIIFVVEGKWSIDSPDSEPDMTKWGYLTHTISSNSVIIRSINRGRWYKFRVAAISKSGSFGYSKPTDLFILSSPPKPPTRPQNLTITQVYLSQDTSSVNADISWLPPKRSDLPIENYKLSWYLVENDNDEILNDLDESGEEIEQSDANPPTGSELASANQMNKHTIRGLTKNSKYRLEITATTKHESKILTSKPFKTRLDTGKISLLPVSSSLVSYKKIHFDDDDFDDKDKFNEELSITIQKTHSPLIYNLTVQTPFFLNGLAKAKVSWSVDNLKSSSFNNQQPLFSLTWFAIKCFGFDQSLPNPITASTVHAQFDVYELRFDCDYVVNVRLGQTRLGEAKISPQILSAQFKVPPCSQIEVNGRVKPQCYEKYADVLSGKIDDKSMSRDISHNLVYNLLFSTQSTTTRSTTRTTSKSTTNEYALGNSFLRLPIIDDIEYKIVERSFGSNTYSLEFSWSLKLNFNRKSFQAYQLSVNPRHHTQTALIDGDQFGAIGAIVQKEQNNFIVRDILPEIDYVFQIQCIGNDGRLGPVKSIQFRVEDKQKLELNGINRLVYEDPNESFLIRSAASNMFSSTAKFICILTVLSRIVILRIFV